MIYGDTALFTKLRVYLDDLYRRRPHDDYYDPDTARGHYLTESAHVYVSPELQTDNVVNRLDDVTPDAKCEVRVMQASVRDSRLAVVEHLIAMKQGGCKVTVVSGNIEPAAKAALARAGIAMRQKAVHDKAFIVHGKFGTVYQYRVYTGSQNLSGSAAHKYDEIFVKLAAETGDVHPLYDAYLTHFADAYDNAVPVR
jgi:phosphatidylserine/phosphatidylglycerophosphate/cardiolipin synthase-like enzyme